MMEWWQQNDCPLCGAPNCWCDCLEQLRAFNKKQEIYHESTAKPRVTLWQRIKRWFLGT